jgi:hypothetical protein
MLCTKQFSVNLKRIPFRTDRIQTYPVSRSLCGNGSARYNIYVTSGGGGGAKHAWGVFEREVGCGIWHPSGKQESYLL